MHFSRLLSLAACVTLATSSPFPAPTDDTAAASKSKNDDKPVNEISCNGKKYVYESLAGYGTVAANARDKKGDTLGGFGSSIALDKKSWKKEKGKDGAYSGVLYALPDRGWNTQGTLNYQNRIQKFSITFTPNPSATKSSPAKPNVDLKLLDTILLTGPDGNPTTGLDADVKGSITYPGFPALPVATYKGDGFGGSGSGGKRISLDTEGLVLGPDGSFWISDEYGPYIYRFSSSGKLLSAIAPPDAIIPHRNSSVSFSANSPPVYEPDRVVVPAQPTSGRTNNQGFEGLTLSEDGKTLSVLLQSAATQEGGGGDTSRLQARFLQYDVSGKTPEYKKEYVVTLPGYTTKKGKGKIAAQSEILSLGKNQFFVLARDSGAGRGQDDTESLYRHVDVFDIDDATNIKSKDNDKEGAAIASKDGVLNAGIKAATYCPFLDFNNNDQLAKFGVRNGGAQSAGLLDEKWESLALAPVLDDDKKGKEGGEGEYFLISVSDNDFITQDGAMNGGKYPYKDKSGFDVDSQVLVFKVKIPKGAKPS